MAVEFRLFGGVEASIDGVPVDLGSARQRCVLAVLLIEANTPVSMDTLIDRVWADRSPGHVRTSVHSYLTRLRRALPAATTGVEITRRDRGYVLTVPEDAVDVGRFQRLLAEARSAGQTVTAIEHYEAALTLSRNQPFAGLETEWLTTARATITRQRNAAQLEFNDLRLRHGQHDLLVAELADHADSHPWDERLAGQLMLALYRGGRPTEALRCYQGIRRRLADGLGTDPSPALRQLHQRILTADPALDLVTTQRATRPAAPTTTTAPRQLPAAPAAFVGRTGELAALTATVDRACQDGTMPIATLAGPGGIGKTWLALRWAHQHASRFPDGQLFVDLNGFGPRGEPMSPATAIRGFLTAIGVGAIPADPHAQAALWRTMTMGRRMLVVLDNAADTAQVTPLLPGSPTVTVLVTSRDHLTGLITGHGTHHLPVDVLSSADARTVLSYRLGAARLAAEPDAVGDLLARCGGYPLALTIVAGRATTAPNLRLAAIAAELGTAPLAALADDDPSASLPAVLSWSVATLTDEQARVFCLLGRVAEQDIGVDVAAGRTGLAAGQAHQVLRRLTQVSLLRQVSAGRYGMHDLIRHYAGRLTPPEPIEALRAVG